jgi:hypothetical protein
MSFVSRLGGGALILLFFVSHSAANSIGYVRLARDPEHPFAWVTRSCTQSALSPLTSPSPRVMHLLKGVCVVNAFVHTCILIDAPHFRDAVRNWPIGESVFCQPPNYRVQLYTHALARTALGQNTTLYICDGVTRGGGGDKLLECL